MTTVLDQASIKQVLNSDVSNQYGKTLSQSTSGLLTQTYTIDLQQRLNAIYLKYPALTPFQKGFLGNLFIAFSVIESTIDPAKINFNDMINEDDELLLWYRSKKGLVNLSIHTEELSSLSFVSKFYPASLDFFYEEAGIDFEGLAYAFLSKTD